METGSPNTACGGRAYEPLGGVVEQDDAVVAIGDHDGIRRGVEEQAVAAFRSANSADEPDEHRAGDRQQQRRRSRGDHEQEIADPPRPLTEDGRESVLEHRQLLVERADVGHDRVDLAWAAIPGLDQGMEPVAVGDQLVDQTVTFGPDRDRAVDVAHLPEDAERGHQRGDVGRVVATLGEPGRRHVEIGFGLLQLDPGDLVPARHRDRLEIRRVLHLVLRLRIPDQVEDGVFLVLAVKPFAADIGSNAGLDLQAEIDDPEEPDGRDHEKGDADPQPTPVGIHADPGARTGQMTSPKRSDVAANHTPVDARRYPYEWGIGHGPCRSACA